MPDKKPKSSRLFGPRTMSLKPVSPLRLWLAGTIYVGGFLYYLLGHVVKAEEGERWNAFLSGAIWASAWALIMGVLLLALFFGRRQMAKAHDGERATSTADKSSLDGEK